MGGELYGGSGSGGEVCADVMLRRQAGLQVYRMYAMLIDSPEELTPIRGWNPFRCRCQRLTSLTNCNASSLPPEILDLILNHLHDEPTTLGACCVVSKSLIQQTRKHSFACVEIFALESHIELWKKASPDPSNPPARHTRNLSIRGLSLVTAVDADVGGGIRTFLHSHLECNGPKDHRVSLTLFHGLSIYYPSLDHSS